MTSFLNRHDIPGVDGSCFIYQRQEKGIWQYFIGLPLSASKSGNNTIRKSCKTKDIEKAKRVAYDAYKDVWKDIDQGRTVQKKSFKKVAKEMLSWMQDSNKKGLIKDYKEKLDKYLIPFFGSKNITEIKQKDINEFWEWRVAIRKKQLTDYEAEHKARVERERLIFERKEERRKQKEGDNYKPKAFEEPIYKPRFESATTFSESTIQSEIAPLNAVFKYACGGSNPLMSDADVPNIGMPDKSNIRARINVSRKKNPRSAFTKDEVEEIIDYFEKRFERRKNAFYKNIKNSTSPKCRALRDKYMPLIDDINDIENFVSWRDDEDTFSAHRLLFAVRLLSATGMRPKSMVDLRIKDVLKLDKNKQKKSVHREYNKKRFQHLARESKLDEDAKVRARYMFKVSTSKGTGEETKRDIISDASASHHIFEYVKFIGREDENKLLFDISAHSLNTAFKRAICEPDSPLGESFLIDFEGNSRSLYSLRHYYITQKIIDGMGLPEIAESCLTSTAVIDKYYKKLTLVQQYDRFSGYKDDDSAGVDLDW